ncbi:MAG: carbohydrate binding family 9 domain-containing protein [Marinilabiliales bacterium]|nr:carbohydrate binding family 9 domain-containing protein [Marinilabiliales bacterium]
MKFLFPAACLLYALPYLTYSQESPKKTYLAEKCRSEIVLDGDPDEPAWEGPWEGGFVQREPYENKQPSQDTQFKVCFDDEFIYVAIKALDTAPDSIVNRLSRRDKMDGDVVGILFDSYHDRRTAFAFFVSASGVKTDQTFSEDGAVEDLTWDPIWYVKTRKHTWGWCAEMKIPLTQLRFEKGSGKIWGMDVLRTLFRKNELSLWQPISRTSPGFTSLFGEIRFNGDLKPRKQIDLTPYVTAKVNTYPREEGNPFSTGSENKFNAGLDGKIGVTNDLTLDLSINPDFGQVEADPSQVNLTAYETFFVEKRPFFIEGNNITRFQLGFGDGDLSTEQLFYSRRIGRKPQYSPDVPSDQYIKEPEFSPILAAAKLTGKTSKGLSVGIIESLGGKESASLGDANQSHTIAVEPFTSYFVGRIQKDFKGGNTILGLMATSTDRKLDDQALIDYLHKNGRSAGIDFKQYFHKKEWLFQLNTVFSQVNGSKEAIDRTQTSSVHLFQRPDATHLDYNPNATSLSGQGGNIQLLKVGGRFNCLFATMWKSPGLDLNDIGYLRSTDEIFQVTWMGYRFTKPLGIMRSAQINFNQWNLWDFSGTHILTGGNFNGHLQLTNQWSFHAGFNMDTESLQASQLRGGPMMLIPGDRSLWYYIVSDPRKKISFQYRGMHLRQNNESASMDQYAPSRNKNDLQYIDALDYGNSKRYVLGDIDQKIFSFSFRVNLNILPNLTVQYWGQPFITAGKYSRYKYVTQARAKAYAQRFMLLTPAQVMGPDENDTFGIDENKDGQVDYRFDNPNFNFKEFLSNLVVRWEYLPGSTLYLVWSQNRRLTDTSGNFDYWENFRQLYQEQKPNNTVMLKLSYRIGMH